MNLFRQKFPIANSQISMFILTCLCMVLTPNCKNPSEAPQDSKVQCTPGGGCPTSSFLEEIFSELLERESSSLSSVMSRQEFERLLSLTVGNIDLVEIAQKEAGDEFVVNLFGGSVRDPARSLRSWIFKFGPEIAEGIARGTHDPDTGEAIAYVRKLTPADVGISPTSDVDLLIVPINRSTPQEVIDGVVEAVNDRLTGWPGILYADGFGPEHFVEFDPGANATNEITSSGCVNHINTCADMEELLVQIADPQTGQVTNNYHLGNYAIESWYEGKFRIVLTPKGRLPLTEPLEEGELLDLLVTYLRMSRGVFEYSNLQLADETKFALGRVYAKLDTPEVRKIMADALRRPDQPKRHKILMTLQKIYLNAEDMPAAVKWVEETMGDTFREADLEKFLLEANLRRGIPPNEIVQSELYEKPRTLKKFLDYMPDIPTDENGNIVIYRHADADIRSNMGMLDILIDKSKKLMNEESRYKRLRGTFGDDLEVSVDGSWVSDGDFDMELKGIPVSTSEFEEYGAIPIKYFVDSAQMENMLEGRDFVVVRRPEASGKTQIMFLHEGPFLHGANGRPVMEIPTKKETFTSLLAAFSRSRNLDEARNIVVKSFLNVRVADANDVEFLQQLIEAAGVKGAPYSEMVFDEVKIKHGFINRLYTSLVNNDERLRSFSYFLIDNLGKGYDIDLIYARLLLVDENFAAAFKEALAKHPSTSFKNSDEFLENILRTMTMTDSLTYKRLYPLIRHVPTMEAIKEKFPQYYTGILQTVIEKGERLDHLLLLNADEEGRAALVRFATESAAGRDIINDRAYKDLRYAYGQMMIEHPQQFETEILGNPNSSIKNAKELSDKLWFAFETGGEELFLRKMKHDFPTLESGMHKLLNESGMGLTQREKDALRLVVESENPSIMNLIKDYKMSAGEDLSNSEIKSLVQQELNARPTVPEAAIDDAAAEVLPGVDGDAAETSASDGGGKSCGTAIISKVM